MKLIEADMVCALKCHIYPKMRNDEWKSFLMNIDANFQHPRVDQHSESFTDVFLLLQMFAVVSLGNYEKLLEAVKNIDVRAKDIIVKATKEIKAIQDSIPGIATREELKGQLTDMHKKNEDLERQMANVLKTRTQEDVYNLFDRALSLIVKTRI
ncbi:uncharacterized protein LOC110449318 isoform X2 [Mizuhopecten yessoensis]|uniref:uncharacterized protein LOC110449318 isoform X2 n=1 Tax=Mizuhopecten yessoensis TaxID=6573 RepID=UPI000B45B92C|nr:uncharacterized protein LOC110449318 isoform X2 [Mizuhopecten yessoensis]